MEKHENYKTILDVANFGVIWAWFVGVIPTITTVVLPLMSLIWLVMRMYQTYLEIKKVKKE
jgi:RsiW-degrading membrane proteinase PrsW (M82 family)